MDRTRAMGAVAHASPANDCLVRPCANGSRTQPFLLLSFSHLASIAIVGLCLANASTECPIPVIYFRLFRANARIPLLLCFSFNHSMPSIRARAPFTRSLCVQQWINSVYSFSICSRFHFTLNDRQCCLFVCYRCFLCVTSGSFIASNKSQSMEHDKQAKRKKKKNPWHVVFASPIESFAAFRVFGKWEFSHFTLRKRNALKRMSNGYLRKVSIRF